MNSGHFLQEGMKNFAYIFVVFFFLPDCGILANLSVCVDLNGISIS